MTRITTHVLDIVLGKPVTGLAVLLERQEQDRWTFVALAETDKDGRCQNLAPEAAAGLYRLTFQTGAYVRGNGRNSIYSEIAVTFHCTGDELYHLPLLLSDNGYTTYRGS